MKIEQSHNILNWYPFKESDTILILGEDIEELVNMLNKKSNNVTRLKTFKYNDLKNKEYDFIILIGILENWDKIIEPKINLEKLIEEFSNNLKENGKMLLAVDNKFGLKFFAGNPEKILNKKFESLIGYNNETEKIETFTKTKLELMLNKLGYNTRFYYPLPDYKIPNVIFTDEQLPEYNSIDKYNPYFDEKSDILFNEIDVFREILKTDKDMFTFFANSFLVELTKGECNKDYKYISFNNIRKEEYRLITKIGDKYVEKQMVTDKSEKHYNNIKNNIKILEKNNIKTLDYIENGIIKSKYVDQKFLLNNVLTEKLEQGNNEEFYNIIDNYIKIINKNTSKKEYDNTIFKKYNIEIKNKEILKNLNFLDNGLWDMTFKNCFYVNNEFLFFDQEWEEDNLPTEYILYRSIYYTISLRRFLKIDDLYKKYNLTQYIDIFKELDNKIQETIRDDDTWKFYSENHYFDIDATKQEIINLNKRSYAKDERIKELVQQNIDLNKKNIELEEKLETGFFRRLQNKIDNRKNN